MIVVLIENDDEVRAAMVMRPVARSPATSWVLEKTVTWACHRPTITASTHRRAGGWWSTRA